MACAISWCVCVCASNFEKLCTVRMTYMPVGVYELEINGRLTVRVCLICTSAVVDIDISVCSCSSIYLSV